jgi:uncharacterized protein (DUF2342 family)
MNTRILFAAVVLVLLSLVGCDEDMAQQIDQAVTDANGAVQVTAEQLQAMVQQGLIAVKTIPDFPYGKAIAAALSTISVILTLILGWRKQQKTGNALADVVRGNEIYKKGQGVDAEAFKKAQNEAQSTETVRIVSKMRQKVS